VNKIEQIQSILDKITTLEKMVVTNKQKLYAAEQLSSKLIIQNEKLETENKQLQQKMNALKVLSFQLPPEEKAKLNKQINKFIQTIDSTINRLVVENK
jgi:Holliday junction resolvasome RuvABC DNA-binding subunit